MQDQFYSKTGPLGKLLGKHAMKTVVAFLGTDLAPTARKLQNMRPKVSIAEWDGYDSGYKFAKGMLNGAIDVLPDESFLAYCKSNGTAINTKSKTLKTEYESEDYDDALSALQKVL